MYFINVQSAVCMVDYYNKNEASVRTQVRTMLRTKVHTTNEFYCGQSIGEPAPTRIAIDLKIEI
ncbi:MAG: hypothetical protein MUE44_09425 [Oscillatoriaceae cyanobacterium Prado104]|nr:hypothetical protein [Oscillatoriaceae cyanobacterium Prado104]